MNLSKEYWNQQYKVNNVGWDLGRISPPLKEYLNQLTDKDIRILIPGGGNSYEAEFLYNKGFNNVSVIDISEIALKNIKRRIPSFPSEKLILGDFFDLNLTFDLIIEQTFFCALNPMLRKAYASKMSELLEGGGRLVGLLFNVTLHKDRPPFGGNKEEYLTFFEPLFDVQLMENCTNSIEERAGMELFVKLGKK